MKISAIPAVLALVLTAALTYLVHHIGSSDADSTLLAIGTALSLLLTLLPAMAMSLESGRLSVNLKVWSGTMFLLALIVAFCFAALGVHVPTYITFETLLLVVHLLVVWKFTENKRV